MSVADDICDEGENNSADELVTPRKPDKGRGVARMQAKFVMVAENGKLRDWSRGAMLQCLEVLGVKVAGSSNQRQMRDLAMQQALLLLAQWDAFVPATDRVTRSAPLPSSSQPSCSQPVDDMDGLIDELMDGSHIFARALLLSCAVLSIFRKIRVDTFSPFVPYVCFVWWSFNFPTFPAPTFSVVSPFGFRCIFFFATFHAHTFNFPTFPAPTFSLGSPFGFPCLPFFWHISCSHLFPIFPLWCSQCFLFCAATSLIDQGGSPMIFQLCPPFSLGGGGQI